MFRMGDRVRTKCDIIAGKGIIPAGTEAVVLQTNYSYSVRHEFLCETGGSSPYPTIEFLCNLHEIEPLHPAPQPAMQAQNIAATQVNMLPKHQNKVIEFRHRSYPQRYMVVELVGNGPSWRIIQCHLRERVGLTYATMQDFVRHYNMYVEYDGKNHVAQSGCAHIWQHYKGFHVEEFDFCTKCDAKKNVRKAA